MTKVKRTLDRRTKPRGTGQRIRVLSYNIHQGLTVHRKQLALSMLKEAILSLKADLVCLQEVAGHQRGGLRDKPITSFQLEALADSIWPYTAYGRNSVFSGGFHGNAILSRYPILRWQNVDISVKFAEKGLMKILPKRGMLHAEIELPKSPTTAHVLGTHFGLLQFERHQQMQRLCHYVKEHVGQDSPFLIAGDFNDWREIITSRLARVIKAEEAYRCIHRRHARTFPARFPVLCLDRIYFRGFKVRHASRLSGRPWLFLSDHLPLLVEFEIP